jgi:two-component system, NtrC family, response regulator AtoC
LVDFFLAHYNKKFRKSVQGLSEEATRLMVNYDWPGNVRELKNALERAMILEDGKLLKPDDLPFSVASGRRGLVGPESAPTFPTEAEAQPGKRKLPALSIPDGGTSLEDVEHALVELALQQSHGNQIKAAKLLSISRDALRYKMKKFGLMHTEEEEPAAPGTPQ